MRIKSVDNTYLIENRSGRIVIEEMVNEKGEKLISYYRINNFKVNDSEYWEPDPDKLKKVQYKELPNDIRRALRKMKLK
ncbi:hypothetical protein HS7_09650 [Sulfolobales archaeon HS-7]|nr:hypothetical protein HS7_09650 [Sulfolobales archaeon HS-7]